METTQLSQKSIMCRLELSEAESVIMSRALDLLSTLDSEPERASQARDLNTKLEEACGGLL